MKKIVFLLCLACLFSFRDQDTGTVIIARHKLYAGVTGTITIFADSKFLCTLDNNAYTEYPATGKHTFHAQWDGKQAKENAVKEAITIDVQPGKYYYLQAIKDERGLKAVLLLEEITASTWERIKGDLK